MTEIGGGAKKDDGSEKQYLNVMIHEAWGLGADGTAMWDERFTEGYVRVELRGGPRTQKFATYSQKVENFALRWEQEIRLELTDEYKELRIMLCKEAIRDSHARRSSSVVAACGIYIDQILEAVPIDKAFELFKAGDGQKVGSIGGFIRVTLKLGNSIPKITTIEEDEGPQEQLELIPTTGEDAEAVETSGGSGGKRMRIMRNILFLAGAAAAVAVVRVKTHQRKRLT